MGHRKYASLVEVIKKMQDEEIANISGGGEVGGTETMRNTEPTLGNGKMARRKKPCDDDTDEDCGSKKSVKEDNMQEGADKDIKGDKEAYQKFFDNTLKKYGATEPDKLSDEDKKKFFDEVDAGWKGDNEKPEANEGKKILRVIRNKKMVKKVVCTKSNERLVNGKCVAKDAKFKKTLKKAAKRRNITMKGKSKAQANRKRKMSLAKRH